MYRLVIKFTPFLVVMLSFFGCVSSAVKPYIGRSYTDIQIDWGKPVNEFETSEGNRVVQYRWGGGTYAIPTTTSGTVTTIGSSSFIKTETFGGGVIHSDGCLVTFIMEKKQNDWVVKEARWPQRAFC
ncbi:MAG: hypothetical protein K8H74_08830 [Notoacmeibacter sp.]|nr:hypothetical protein [Notoacmeibacter sp.]